MLAVSLFYQYLSSEVPVRYPDSFSCGLLFELMLHLITQMLFIISKQRCGLLEQTDSVDASCWAERR